MYYSWSSFQLKKHQQKIEMILDSKKIDYDKVDIAGNEGAKQKMREVMGNPTGLPPQLIKGNTHLGVSFINEMQAYDDRIIDLQCVRRAYDDRL